MKNDTLNSSSPAQAELNFSSEQCWGEPDHVPVPQFIQRIKPQFILWITQLWRTQSERKRRKQMLSPQLIDKGRSRHIWISWKWNIFNMTSSSSLWQIRIRCPKIYSQVTWISLEIHTKKTKAPGEKRGEGRNLLLEKNPMISSTAHKGI